MSKRVLVVAYYFPPMGLSGVQRVAKFVKYLPAYGWQPHVLTVEPAGYFAYDETLLDDVDRPGVVIHRTRSWDPTRLFGRRETVALPDETQRRALAWLTSLLFVPDNKIGWMPHALRAGRRVLGDAPFDAIFSTAPPYTAHLIAARLSRWSGLPLVVDFRDDWVDNPRHCYPTPLHRRLHQWLERHVLRASRHAVTINTPIQCGLLERNAVEGVRPSVSVIPQGFDPEDFETPPVVRDGQAMRLVYTGIFYDAQTPDYFLLGLAQFIADNPAAREDVDAVFVGLVPEASQRLVERLGLTDVVRYAGYLPHDEAVAHQRAADVLWMTIGRRPGAEGISTGKLFEYVGARKPILALVPEGAARAALQGHGAAVIVAPDDVTGIRRALAELWRQWRAQRLPLPNEAFVQQYDRRVLAGQLARLLDQEGAPT